MSLRTLERHRPAPTARLPDGNTLVATTTGGTPRPREAHLSKMGLSGSGGLLSGSHNHDGLKWTARLPVARARGVLAVHPLQWSRISRCGSRPQHKYVAEECYGELREPSIDRMLAGLPGPGAPCSLLPDDSFTDVGSGFGRLAMYVRLRSNVSRVVGIERNPCRHAEALLGKSEVERLSPAALDGLELVRGDVRTLGLGNATHLFMSIQCWPPDLIHTIAQLARHAPRLRCMVVNARGANALLHKNATILSALESWGELSSVETGLRATWTEESEVIHLSRLPRSVKPGPGPGLKLGL